MTRTALIATAMTLFFATSLAAETEYVSSVATYKASITKKMPGGRNNPDLILSYYSRPFSTNYSAASGSSLPDDDPYVVQRGADKGLISLMNEQGRRVKQFVVPHGDMRSVVRLRNDSDAPDLTDLIFNEKNLYLVRTYARNAGIFIGSDVYRLPHTDGNVTDRAILGGNKDLEAALAVGLEFHRTALRGTH